MQEPSGYTPTCDATEVPGLLSIVVCARNEASSIVEVLERLHKSFPDAELLLVDNASTDETFNLAASLRYVRIVREVRPGKGAAMRTGAKCATGEWLLFHDADLEYCIEDAKEVVNAAVSLNACCVGTRLVRYDQLRLSSWLVNGLIQTILRARLGRHIPDVLSGTRCLRRALFLALSTSAVGFGIETELARGLLRRPDVSCLSSPVRFAPRTIAQGKKIRSWHLVELIAQALK